MTSSLTRSQKRKVVKRHHGFPCQGQLRAVGLVLLFILAGCQSREKSIGFYYWRTSFHLDTVEESALQSSGARRLFVRYFDISIPAGDSIPKPIAALSFDTVRLTFPVIPVIYIRNRVFENSDTASIALLCKHTWQLVNKINASIHQDPPSIQFDCDWTTTTRSAYFLFLKKYKEISRKEVTATIRLHQVKYPAQSGIPPVDAGVLMYYNMGEIDGGTNNSIYDKSTAAKYIPFLRKYPVTLDLALPIFSWSLQVRNGKVIKLLNKMNFLHFRNDTNFISSGENRYAVKHSCFHGGYYFKEEDILKCEQVQPNDLFEMIDAVNKYSNGHMRNLLFYDLDTDNLKLYEKNIFSKALAHLN